MALARGFALEPAFLLLDEPTNGLDNENIVLLKGHLEHHRAAGRSVIFASHNPQFVRAASDRWTFLKDGSAVFDGPTALWSSGLPGEVASFLAALEI